LAVEPFALTQRAHISGQRTMRFFARARGVILAKNCRDSLDALRRLSYIGVYYDTRRKSADSREEFLMAKELPSLGELEIHVLRWVWQEQPCTERQVWDVARQERKIGRTTVLKTMQRLEAKGLLTRVRGEGPVQFRAAIDQRRLLPAIVRRFVDRTLGGSLAPLVAYLADSAELSAKDVAALRTIARKMAEDDKQDG
jgi:BlaI family transcriptional regulator, penicillinase repressor